MAEAQQHRADEEKAVSSDDHTTQIDPEAILEFLENVWQRHRASEEEWYAFISWKDNRGGWHDEPISCRMPAKRIRALIVKRSNCDLYFCPNLFSEPRRLKSCALPSVWGWCDIDHDKLSRFPVQPSIVWETSPGRLQALWLWDYDHSVSDAEKYSKALSDYSVDRNSKSITKALRIPGTFNYKRARPYRVRIVRSDESVISERPRIVDPLLDTDGPVARVHVLGWRKLTGKKLACKYFGVKPNCFMTRWNQRFRVVYSVWAPMVERGGFPRDDKARAR
jgi:hypothetical protein